ncbi:DoxX family protein [Myxococcus sp. CA033]|uniref:DoxX family protein n=1 Tax=Myxococcus sp. CA033 TaxID=2741516 RepID=UPI00157B43A5|nr:DoxX family protein [Myxococcus sp. CA033]NTX33292.1 DoxX family protein [Myxococcus sp. CA033]
MTTAITGSTSPSKTLPASLWLVQALLGILFAGTGLWKLLTPVAALAAMIPWAGQVPVAFLYATALFDLLGGIGVVLPSLTRIKPGLTVLAALGCAALQASAILFHLSRGEAANTPFNFLLVGLSLFVAWGRRSRAPIQPRS